MTSKTRLKGAIPVAILALASVLWFQSGRDAAAPDVTFTTLKGQKVALRSLQGQPVMVTFWATTCASCIKEIPLLKTLYREYAAISIEIIAVAMFHDPPNRVVEMVEAMQLPYPVALDLRAEHARAFGDVRVTPTTFLIAPDGTLAWKKTGLIDEWKIRREIDNFCRRDTSRCSG